ncbi:MAG: DUF3592 domain-containing protein [Azonexus sp.]
MPPDTPPSHRGSRSWEFVGFGMLILGLTLYFAYALLWSTIRQMQTADFVPVTATVIASSVEESSTRFGTTTGSVRQFRPRIVYAYSVAGIAFESDRFNFAGPGWKDRDAAQAVVSRYPAGTTVTAYCDPHDPRVAVLDKAAHPLPWPWAVALLAISVFALLAIYRGLRLRP